MRRSRYRQSWAGKALGLGFQGFHVDHETVFHVAFNHAFNGLVDVFDVEHFDVAGNPVLGAEIQHLLGFGNATDQRTGQHAALEYRFVIDMKTLKA